MQSYNEKIEIFCDKLNTADAILVGAASGMSSAAGFRHYYEHDEGFVKLFSDFEKKYGYKNSFDGFYYPYRKTEQRWAFIARMVCGILDAETGEPYKDIFEILKDKNFHILTTNQDIQFTRVFPEEKISAIQGDWRYFQCRRRCHDEIYPAEEICRNLNNAIDENMEIPTSLIPRCPECGAEMEPWVRSRIFLEGDKYEDEYRKVREFIRKNKDKKIIFLELGVGRMTPMFIQEPFWNLTYSMENSFYITINPRDALVPDEIADRSLKIDEDIARVLKDTRKITESAK